MAYEPEKIEKEIYNLWEKGKFFQPKKGKKPYVVTIPPPNITGALHMGHALNNTIQDILVRYHRMNQEPTLWVPGTDHAGIATQNKVEKELKEQGKTRHDIGREKFVELTHKWKEKHIDIIIDQLKKLGCSCDWSRTRFTLDKGYAKAVETAFNQYHKKGYIYQGPRIVNWCPRCSTAISDIEIKYKPEKTKLWYIKYPLKDSKKFITVATTRPETMLGDTAVVVNPKDERYKDLIGKKVILPLINRKIPIISHRLVEKDFGTGALKLTPAHSVIDNKIGKENKLEIINVIGEDGKITENGKQYAGLTIKETRNKILEDLQKLNLLEKQEDYEHSLSLCDRCNTPIEPLISKQWFVKMDKLVKPAIQAVKKDKIKFYPKRYKKIYLDWMENIDDWCISRQLWWGHKIPIKGETDVLDTWFSSALWPFAVLGWPEKTQDMKDFYPTTLLSTAQDIIYLWVARMIFSSLEFLKTIPFTDVYIHSTVLNIEGKRMSKSLETGIDPLELIEKYGADATRFGLMYITSLEQQQIRFSENTAKTSRNFANKLFNINRFIKEFLDKPETKKPKTLADKWIISKLNTLIKNTTNNIKEYKLGEASREIYDFVWHDYADWYVEISKQQDKSLNKEIFETILKLLHPFMPFITEHLYNDKKNPLIISNWPKHNEKLIDKKTEKEFEKIQNKIIEKRKENIKLQDLIKEFL